MLAQLDRALVYGTKGQGFESLTTHQEYCQQSLIIFHPDSTEEIPNENVGDFFANIEKIDGFSKQYAIMGLIGEKMKKKFFSFILALALFIPCTFALTACGSNPDDPGHTHSWSSTYTQTETEHYKICTVGGCTEKSKRANHDIVNNVCTVCGYDNTHTHTFTPNDYEHNANYHWQECTTCDGTSNMQPHQMSGNTCSICGYVKQSQGGDTISAIRDLEIMTFQSELKDGNAGTFTLVKLPDGKNMLIDASTYKRSDKSDLERYLYHEEIDAAYITLDYFVLTSTISERTGGAPDVISYGCVENLYIPNTTGVGYELSNSDANTKYFLETVEYAEQQGCTIHTITDSMQDITNTFVYGGVEYSYTIDFMTPVAPENCTEQVDSSVYIAITYKDKTILLTSDVTNKNIDAYAVVNGNPKYAHDVDVLITSYWTGGQDAIRHSGVRGSLFLEDIGLTNSDYVIITNLGETTGIELCTSAIARLTHNIISTAAGYPTVTVKVTNAGTLSVTKAE